MTKELKSQICTKCGGTGNIDWSNQDGGVCYKCEGNGYLGEKPQGFKKSPTQAVIKEAKKMVEGYIGNLIFNGNKDFMRTYEQSEATIARLIEMKKVIRFKYTKFWMEQPDMEIKFGGWTGVSEYCYQLTVGGEFVVIRPVKR